MSTSQFSDERKEGVALSKPYLIVLLHDRLDEFADAVRHEVRRLCKKALLQPDLVGFVNAIDETDEGAFASVVYLGSEAGRISRRIEGDLSAALNRQLPILPLYRSSRGESPSQVLPDILQRYNATDWDLADGAGLATLLGSLGLIEKERRVFISYRRSESESLAIQLHTRLVQQRFDVFLDRFTISPGLDVQKKLDQDLEDKAFVLLIESRGLHDSPWVQHEIAYAHSHRISVLALTLPDVADSELVPSIDDAFRCRLRADDVTREGQLSEERLRDVLRRIEFEHARALHRRREQLMGSVKDLLFTHDREYRQLDDWAVAVQPPNGTSTVYMVTPRHPRPEDLYALHEVCEGWQARGGPEAGGVLVHEGASAEEHAAAVIDWISGLSSYRSAPLHRCVGGGGSSVTELRGGTVFLSASFPSGSRGAEFRPFDAHAIADAVSSLVRMVLISGGRLVFGGHPTITPLVLLIGTELRVQSSVDIYQSRFFESEITEATMRLADSGVGSIRWTESRPTREASLRLMRTEMLREARLIGAVFVGGMQGVRDEYVQCGHTQPLLPRLPIAAPGGAAAKLPPAPEDDAITQVARDLRSPHYPFVASRIVDVIGTAAPGPRSG